MDGAMPAAHEEKSAVSARRVRSGRPPKEFAGEVEERILDAARKVFLERGFEGASVEEIAETARAGKPTIYARFPNKQALFEAAFTRYIAEKNTRIANSVPAGESMEERLSSAGAAVLAETLTSESIGLARLAVAEARNFPDLASSVCRTARERGAETLARLLSEVSEPGHKPECSPERQALAARYFLDLVLLPILMRALSGECLEALRSEIGPHLAQRVPFFLAACRNGGLSGTASV